MKERTIDMNTSMRHLSDQLQTRTQKFDIMVCIKTVISLIIFMSELIHISRLIKTLHNCADCEWITPQRWMVLLYKIFAYMIQLCLKVF